MKSKISAGCQVSSLLILIVLVIEYGLFFLEVPFDKVSFLMMLGYFFLTYIITCNNHGRNVHLYYERELSLLFKCIATDFVMGVFLYTYYSDHGKTRGIGILFAEEKWWIGYIFMLVMHLISILALCIFWNKCIYPGNKGRILYIYEKETPKDMRIIDGCISIDETEKKLIAEIMSNEIIYIYDVTAEKRNG